MRFLINLCSLACVLLLPLGHASAQEKSVTWEHSDRWVCTTPSKSQSAFEAEVRKAHKDHQASGFELVSAVHVPDGKQYCIYTVYKKRAK